jgi:hypothetical protein
LGQVAVAQLTCMDNFSCKGVVVVVN